MLMRSSPPTTEQMLVALCPLKPTNPKPRGPPRRAALWLRKNPQLRSSFIADDNEQYRPKIAGGDFLPGVHIRVGGFADVSQSNGKRNITIYPVFRVLYPNQGDSGRRFGPIDGRSTVYSGCVPGCHSQTSPLRLPTSSFIVSNSANCRGGDAIELSYIG